MIIETNEMPYVQQIHKLSNEFHDMFQMIENESPDLSNTRIEKTILDKIYIQDALAKKYNCIDEKRRLASDYSIHIPNNNELMHENTLDALSSICSRIMIRRISPRPYHFMYILKEFFETAYDCFLDLISSKKINKLIYEFSLSKNVDYSLHEEEKPKLLKYSPDIALDSEKSKEFLMDEYSEYLSMQGEVLPAFDYVDVGGWSLEDLDRAECIVFLHQIWGRVLIYEQTLKDKNGVFGKHRILYK